MRKLFYCTLIGMALLQSVPAGNISDPKDVGAIWFIGDSITQSNADDDPTGSPRKSLYDLLTAAGYTFSFTGHHQVNVDGLPSTGSTPAGNLYQYHSGISGSVIGDNIKKRVGMTERLTSFWTNGRLSVVKPDVVLIMLGSNDAGLSYEMDHAASRLRVLLESLYQLPDFGEPTIFLATIPPNRRDADQTANVQRLNTAVPEIVAELQKQGRDIHLVDQFTPLNAAYRTAMRRDNLHPIAAGNEIMAQQWLNAIQAVQNAD